MNVLNENKLSKKLLITGFVVYYLCLIILIIFKFNAIPDDLRVSINPPKISWIPFMSDGKITIQSIFSLEYILNIICYIPYGFYIYKLLENKKIYLMIIFTFISSFCFEAFQYIIHLGTVDTGDLITNTLGGIIGIIIIHLLNKKLSPKFINIVNIIIINIGILLIIYGIITTIPLFKLYFTPIGGDRPIWELIKM